MNLLIYAAIPLFAVYFYLFRRTLLLLTADERRRFIEKAALPAWRRVLAIVPFVLLIFVSALWLRMVLALWLIAQLALDTRTHQRKLEALSFDPRFRLQLLRIAYFGGIVILTFSTGMVIQAR